MAAIEGPNVAPSVVPNVAVADGYAVDVCVAVRVVDDVEVEMGEWRRVDGAHEDAKFEAVAVGIDGIVIAQDVLDFEYVNDLMLEWQ